MSIDTKEIEKRTATRLGMSWGQVSNILQVYADEFVKATMTSKPAAVAAAPAVAAVVSKTPVVKPTRAAAKKAEVTKAPAKKATPRKAAAPKAKDEGAEKKEEAPANA